MIGSIKHLRGTTAEWKANNIVVPDGELAIERTTSGGTHLKIGNGIDRFTDLPSVTGSTIKTDEYCLYLVSGYRYVCGWRSGIELILPEEPDDDFYCEVSFKSRNNIADFSIIGGKTLMSGDGTADGIMIPEPYHYYTILLWYEDGIFHGVSRGVPYEP